MARAGRCTGRRRWRPFWAPSARQARCRFQTPTIARSPNAASGFERSGIHYCAGGRWGAGKYPEAAVLPVNVFHGHAEGRADAGKGEHQKADQCAVAQADHGLGVAAVEELARFGAASTGVLPVRTTYLGPRTAAAGLTARTWPTTSQSNSMRTAASHCLTLGGENSRPRLSTQAATCTGSMSSRRGGPGRTSRRTHHRPVVGARVFGLRMLAVKNSTKRRPACAPRSAITVGTAAWAVVRMMAGRLSESGFTGPTYSSFLMNDRGRYLSLNRGHPLAAVGAGLPLGQMVWVSWCVSPTPQIRLL